MLAYVTHSELVLSKPDRNTAPLLEIRWANAEVDSLTRTHVRFFNGGNQTLSGLDVTDIDPLRIAPREQHKSAGALMFGISAVSRKELGFDVTPDDNGAVAVTFDFMDPSDWALVDVLHTGDRGYHVTGTMRGVRLEPRGLFDPRDPWPMSWTVRHGALIQWLRTGLWMLPLASLAFIGPTAAIVSLAFVVIVIWFDLWRDLQDLRSERRL